MKIRMSIFTKLFLIMIAAGIVINILVAGFFGAQMRNNTRGVLRNNVSIYADYLITMIGVPPDLDKARDISRRTMLDISINGPSLSWSTSSRMPDINAVKNFHRVHNTRFSIFGGKFILVENRRGYQFLFYSSRLPFQWEIEHFIAIVALFMLMLACVYLIIRRILQPVKLLTQGVSQIAAGNLDYQVPEKSADELGELTNSFNSMKNRLKEMLASREQLLRDVSHEIRSPLTRIKVALEFVDDKTVRENIDEEICEIETMISEILETERLKYLDGKLLTEDIDIASFIADIANSMGIAGSMLNIQPHEPPVMIKGDRTWIKILLRNILDNAVKHGSPDGKPIDITFHDNKEAVSVEITDHGPGIPERELSFVFEPFYRVDSSRSRATGGYGLGLSICKKIMAAHSGSLEITSSPGKGTSLNIIFKKY